MLNSRIGNDLEYLNKVLGFFKIERLEDLPIYQWERTFSSVKRYANEKEKEEYQEAMEA